jgi:phosphoserine phosphatase
MKLAPVLVAFDVDGTLLRGETICECIARGIGKIDEMAAFEKLTSQLDIASGRYAMLEWYKPHSRGDLIRHLSTIRLAPGVETGFARLRERGIKIALVSITWQFAVEWLAAKLGADYAIGTGWTDTNEIVPFWPDDKATWLSALSRELGIFPDQLAAVGDSAGDVPMLKFVGQGYYVGPIMPDLPSHVRHWPDADIAKLVEDMIG